MIVNELNSLLGILRGMKKTKDHKKNLDQFYSSQSDSYDYFRKRLLKGRKQMLDLLDIRPKQKIVELGCGTGQNLDFINPSILVNIDRIDLVDICEPLLQKAKLRKALYQNVYVIESSSSSYNSEFKYDRIFFSYSLTMTNDWIDAVKNAFNLLKPGGLIGVVDFYPGPLGNGFVKERIISKFWKTWFAHDGVYLNRDHIIFLRDTFETLSLIEKKAPIPYLGFLKTPYYIYVGRKMTS